MIISCQQCATRYHLASRLVKPRGTKVRCSKCRHIFTAFPIAEAAVDDSFSSLVDVESVDLDDFEADPIDKIDADLRTGGFLEETSNEAAPSTVEDVEWNTEETDMPDLADELDKILGTDESDDDSFLDEISEPIVQDAQPSGMDDLELADLEEGLDDLFGGDDDLLDDDAAVQQTTAEELIDDDHPAIQEITAEDLIVSGSEEIEVIDLGELGDDFTDSSVIEASAFEDGLDDLEDGFNDLLESDTSNDESPITTSDSGSADEISLDELENALDRVEAAEKSRGSELEAETDPDLDLAALLNSEEVPEDNIGQENIGTDTITLESLTESPSDEVVSVEESAGLDTIQIEDFEFDLDNLEDIATESSPPEDLSEEADVALETKEAELADLTSDDGKALVDDDFLESVSENMEGLLPDLDDLDIEDPDIGIRILRTGY